MKMKAGVQFGYLSLLFWYQGLMPSLYNIARNKAVTQ